MQTRKKTAAGLLALIMMLSAASCGSNQNEATGETTTKTGTQNTTEKETDDLDDIIPKETVTLEVYSQLANYSGEQIGWFADVLKEKFNVKLNIINNAEGTFATRMEAGNLGDIVVFGNDSDDYVQAAKAGLLFDWEDEDLLDEYGSYIKEHMGVALDKNRGITGKLL